MDQIDGIALVGSHGESSLPGQPESSRAMQVSNSVNASNAGNVARRFHPYKPDYLHVGNRQSDGREVWLSASRPAPMSYLIFYIDGLGIVREKAFEIDWLDDFKDNNFPGSTEIKRKQARRLVLIDIIGANRHDRTRLGAVDPTERISNLPFMTLLVVSTTNHPTHAPFYVQLLKQSSITDLFDALLDECEHQGQAVENASLIKVKYLWNGRPWYLRKANPEHWGTFWTILREAWEVKRDYFIENDCEIQMVVVAEAA